MVEGDVVLEFASIDTAPFTRPISQCQSITRPLFCAKRDLVRRRNVFSLPRQMFSEVGVPQRISIHCLEVAVDMVFAGGIYDAVSFPLF